MSGLLDPGTVANAATLALTHEPLPAEHVHAGSPTTASTALARIDTTETGTVEIGVWEMTPGTAADTEIDEVFVVLSGSARVEFTHVPEASVLPAPLELAPGSVARLAAGMRTVWTVRETLRKIYIA